MQSSFLDNAKYMELKTAWIEVNCKREEIKTDKMKTAIEEK